jgi:hypothetical protein
MDNSSYQRSTARCVSLDRRQIETGTPSCHEWLAILPEGFSFSGEGCDAFAGIVGEDEFVDEFGRIVHGGNGIGDGGGFVDDLQRDLGRCGRPISRCACAADSWVSRPSQKATAPSAPAASHATPRVDVRVASGPEKASRVGTARRCGLVERGQKVQRKRTSAGRSVTAKPAPTWWMWAGVQRTNPGRVRLRSRLVPAVGRPW